jgi:glycosyltransferase involved in cell wall biosynthesis
MMQGQNIVCFAKDWSEDPTSNNHIMQMLARDNRVLWINSISTRTPKMTSGRDLKKIAAKLGQFARGVDQVGDTMWVFTPIVLPFPHSRTAQAANRTILRQSIRLLRRKLGMHEFQLWSFLPTASPYVGSLGESLAVYFCTDEFSEFSTVDTEKTAAMERDICERADIVFVTANTLLETRLRLNRESHLAKHGVDHAHFARALDGEVEVAPELAGIKPPILGFFGLLHDWVDLDLMAFIARERPQWSIVIIGQAAVDTSRLAALPNVHLLGRKPYADLPRFCKAFSVALIPFVVNELTRHVNPIKLREYMSAGIPVVSTPLPEVTHYEDCYLGDTPGAFLAAVERALAEDSPGARRTRSEAMSRETWERKVEELGARVMKVRNRKA